MSMSPLKVTILIILAAVALATLVMYLPNISGEYTHYTSSGIDDYCKTIGYDHCGIRLANCKSGNTYSCVTNLKIGEEHER